MPSRVPYRHQGSGAVCVPPEALLRLPRFWRPDRLFAVTWRNAVVFDMLRE